MEYNRMQIIKRRFYAMRNGVIADALRKAGLDYPMIFGLNLPQITEIAAEQPHEAGLARELWADRRTRESLMLAPMLFPPQEMDRVTARQWLEEAPTAEVADVLCLKLLRNVDGALDVALGAMTSESDMTRYGALRLLYNLLILAQSGRGPAGVVETMRPFVETEAKADCRLTRPLAVRLLDELDYMTA